jgi:N6-L-threonylcarbamoyladenine synthase
MVHPKAVFFGGGVTQNGALRARLAATLPLPLFWPSAELCLDNAAMIAGLGFHTYARNPRDERFSLEPQTRISF